MASVFDSSATNASSQAEVSEEGAVLYQVLIGLCENNASFFECDPSESGQKLKQCSSSMLESLRVISQKVEELRKVAPNFDFDEKTPHNGYRSTVCTVDLCTSYCIKLSRQILVNRGSYFFRKAHYVKELETCAQMLDSLNQILDLNLKILSWTDMHNLFAMNKSSCFEEIYIKISEISLYCFFGRCIGFQFTESLQQVVKTLGIMLASFSEVYYSDGNSMLTRATNSVWHSSKYLLDPELRAKRIVHCTIWASVEFCKAFWFLGEIELMNKVPNLMYSSVDVNRLIKLDAEPLKIISMTGTSVDIPVPSSFLGVKPLNIRLIAKHVYQGMKEDSAASPSKTAPVPKSTELIFHCHGGGFVAQSSRSHEMYLREWAIYLNCPVVSVDYSLAPKAPFPRALEEVLYAYCWTLNNAAQLGSTAEKIIFAGDSAGANLSLSLAFKCIELGVRPPDGIFLAYAPVLISFLPSPARLLSLIDPILPMGFLSACLRAYAYPKSVDDMHKYEHRLKRVSTVKITDPNIPIVSSPVEKPETIIMDVSHMESKYPPNDKMMSLNTNKTPDCDDKTIVSNEKIISAVALEDLPVVVLENSVIKNSPPIETPIAPASVLSLTSSDPLLVGTIQGKEENQDLKEVNVQNILCCPSQEEKLPVESQSSAENLILENEKELGCNEENKVNVVEKDTSKESQTSGADENFSSEKVLNQLELQKSEDDDINSKLRPEFSRAVESVTTAITNVFINFTKSNIQTGRVDQGIEALDEEEASIPLEFFNVKTPEDYFLSPILAPDELLKCLPPVKLLTTEMDPFLDDCVSFAKRMKGLDHNVSLDVLPGLPHGFLTFALINKDANEGSELCCRRIRELFDMPVEEGNETDHLDTGLETSPKADQTHSQSEIDMEPKNAQNSEILIKKTVKPLCGVEGEDKSISNNSMCSERGATRLTIGRIAEKGAKHIKDQLKGTKMCIYRSANSLSEKSVLPLGANLEKENDSKDPDKCGNLGHKVVDGSCESSNGANFVTVEKLRIERISKFVGKADGREIKESTCESAELSKDRCDRHHDGD